MRKMIVVVFEEGDEPAMIGPGDVRITAPKIREHWACTEEQLPQTLRNVAGRIERDTKTAREEEARKRKIWRQHVARRQKDGGW